MCIIWTSHLCCVKDRFEVENQDALCGSRSDIKTYFAKNGALDLRFVTDSTGFGRGYKILVTRQPCLEGSPNNSDDDFTTDTFPVYTTPKFDATTDYYPDGMTSCCSTSYNSKHFTLTSPNFPLSMSSSSECIYPIYRANENVCRLRINALFFWLGTSNTPDCPEGYLEIDGKFVCGCKMDLKLISAFDISYGVPKILRFRTEGIVKGSYSGFILEIFQDECPKRITPVVGNSSSGVAKGFRYYKDKINKVTWPNTTNHEESELVNKTKRSIFQNAPFVNTYSVYVFSYPDYEASPQKPKETEETTYVDTSDIETVLNDRYQYNYCRIWNQEQFNKLYLAKGLALPQCGASQISAPSSNCCEFSFAKGWFKSPGYPFFYPGGLNICYRFRKLPNYCGIRIYMRDFHVQESVNCDKDYFSFDNVRYCGQRLQNTVREIDLTDRDYAEIKFVTDALYCGRGFYGVYEQIACQKMTYPINPINPPTPRPPKTTTEFPITLCDKAFREQTFTLEVYGHSGPDCAFFIYKALPEFCRMKLYFQYFDLACTSEHLIIDGTMYCGRQTGKTVFVDFNKNPISVIYKRESWAQRTGLKLRLIGTQIEDDCVDIEVPAQRSMTLPFLGSKSDESSGNSNTSLFVSFQDNLKEICGIIESSKYSNICDVLIEQKNVTMCEPIKANVIDLPLNLSTRLFKVDNLKRVNFTEIDCEDFNKTEKVTTNTN